MPIYEYKCMACGDQHEAIQKISDSPIVDCPSCGEPALKKLVSAAGFRLSGSGWYETDFKDRGKRNLAEKDSKAPEKSKDSKKSEQSQSSEETKSGKKSASNGKSASTSS